MVDISTQTEDLEPVFDKTIKPKILVLSGGGMKGFAHVGALLALEELNFYKDLDTFAGTSIGGLVCAWAVIGYTPKELYELCIRLEFHRMQNINLTNLVEHFGLDNGEKFEKVIKRIIKEKTKNENISLKQLYESNKKHLILTTTCLEENKVYYLDHISHPDLPLHLAIRMTSSLPFYYTPVKYEDKHYIDGGCIDNFPICCFKNRLREVLGIYLKSEHCCPPIENLETFALQSIYCLVRRFDTIQTEYLSNTIFIIIKNANVLEFNMSVDKKKELSKTGYETIKNIYKSEKTP